MCSVKEATHIFMKTDVFVFWGGPERTQNTKHKTQNVFVCMYNES